MSALPEDIARFTSDGVLITRRDDAIRTVNPNAKDASANERETFFDDPADAEILADELFAYLSTSARPHEAIETDDTLGLGSVIAISTIAPRARLVDTTRDLDAFCSVRAFSFDMASDTYAIELVGAPSSPLDIFATFDSTDTFMDDDDHTMDEDPDAGVPGPVTPPMPGATPSFDTASVTIDSTDITFDGEG